VGGWAAAKKEEQALGSPFLEMGSGSVGGGMFAGMQEEEERERRGSFGEAAMMEVDEKEVLGEAFTG